MSYLRRVAAGAYGNRSLSIGMLGRRRPIARIMDSMTENPVLAWAPTRSGGADFETAKLTRARSSGTNPNARSSFVDVLYKRQGKTQAPHPSGHSDGGSSMAWCNWSRFGRHKPVIDGMARASRDLSIVKIGECGVIFLFRHSCRRRRGHVCVFFDLLNWTNWGVGSSG